VAPLCSSMLSAVSLNGVIVASSLARMRILPLVFIVFCIACRSIPSPYKQGMHSFRSCHAALLAARNFGWCVIQCLSANVSDPGLLCAHGCCCCRSCLLAVLTDKFCSTFAGGPQWWRILVPLVSRSALRGVGLCCSLHLLLLWIVLVCGLRSLAVASLYMFCAAELCSCASSARTLLFRCAGAVRLSRAWCQRAWCWALTRLSSKV
jgi:hypothetical protein